MGPKPKSTPKEIELLKCHHSICLKKTRLFIKIMSQSDEKLPSYANYKVARLSDSWPILGRKLAMLDTFFKISTLNLFCSAFTLRLIGKPNWKSIGPKITI